MSWDEIQGHDAVQAKFRTAVARGRLASTFLFVGPPAIGKRKFALKLAEALLCEVNPPADLNPCGKCESCVQVRAQSHPDLILVSRPANRTRIPVDLLIGDAQNRMRAGLCHDITLRPYRGGRKVAIIDDADYLNVEGANCLLKTLEEPPPKSVMILLSTSLQRQLPTIRSRSQIIRFDPLPNELIATLLVEQGVVAELAEARVLAELGHGSLERAMQVADPELREFRAALLPRLGTPDFPSVPLAKETAEFVDRAGKEAPPRRARLILVMQFAAEFYEQLMRALCSSAVAGDDLLRKQVERAVPRFTAGPDAAAACLARCIEAEQEVESNANLATLVDAWMDDLSSAGRLGYVPLGQ
ncbi:DNA polymerase III subunit [Blastopirellula sp. J2-11]|uniref:DNA polymerase III subunit n=1 Tax=Blastopirellula sp. J2-11 TaxID=2943192 RepID=UPI0021CA20D6|nr:DNA polymerase III subunit [Blastopirellula sp. J2-11]UUO05567.1 DNA polymerase III subunit [Blastopirellula sp. J2-11]